MSNLVLESVVGDDRDWSLVANDYQGKPVTGLLSSDTLSCNVWAGADQPSLFTPTAAWIDATAATWKLSITSAQTSAVTPSRYRIRAGVSRGGRTTSILDAWLVLTERPGSGIAERTYITLADMKRHCPWIERVQEQGDQAGFREERIQATAWFDDIILRHFRPGALWIASQANLIPLDWGMRRSVVVNQWLRDQLNANRLLLADGTGTPTPDGRKIREAIARRAIGLVLSHQLTGANQNPYKELAYEYLATAESLVIQTTAEIDLDGNGVADFGIDLSCPDVLRG